MTKHAHHRRIIMRGYCAWPQQWPATAMRQCRCTTFMDASFVCSIIASSVFAAHRCQLKTLRACIRSAVCASRKSACERHTMYACWLVLLMVSSRPSPTATACCWMSKVTCMHADVCVLRSQLMAR